MVKKKDKCIAIFSAYIPPHVGGIERYTINLVKQFVRLGFKPIVVTTNYDNSDSFSSCDGVDIIRLPIYNVFNNRYPIVKFSKLKRMLMKKLDNYNIESIIVNARFYFTSLIGVNYGYKKNIPVYVIEHGSNYVTLDNKFVDFFANRYEDILPLYLKKRVTGFYGVSNACGKWLERFSIKANGTWYNSIDLNMKNISKKEHDEINFLYAGRIIKQKGVLNILNCFKKLLSKYDNIHLYIAGDGLELDDYKRDFIDKKIHFLGKLSLEELKGYYSICDVFLYPPLWPEGMPSSILEAGVMGCSVIATNQGGIKEIIKDGKNGIIVSKDLDSLETAMEKLILDDKLRDKLSKDLYDTVKEKFTWEVTAKKILKDMNLK